KVIRADGRPVPLLGPPVVPAVTDGSFPSSLLVTSARGDRLGSLDLRSGRNLWLRPAPGSSTLTATAQVGGVALLEHATSVTAVDVRLGANRWRAAVEPGVATGALTDGEVVVLPEPASDGTLMLVARDVADGAERWRVPAPAGTTTLAVVAHQLVAATGDVVVGLG
ncbi:MAG TPA: PQQ-binding-like beta-propeller repeat protein, partial [Actinotalea sp.]|nr:PQQ-binding-like beta-propeller repeat protein [Actinotalea sp.]